MMKICVNGGIPVSMFEKFPELPSFSATSFSHIELFLGNSGRLSIPDRLIDQFNCSIQNFKNHMLKSSAEAGFRVLFWDSILMDILQSGLEYNQSPNYRVDPEWNTSNVFQNLASRKVDLAVLFKPRGIEEEWPIFFVEIGKEPFDTEGNPHKDFSKLMEMMSKSCVDLAYKLASSNQVPDNLIVYGLWIGGSKFQFCTAYPVITSVEDGRFEIHAHLTFEKHWFFDLLKESASSVCIKPCCQPDDRPNILFEKVENGTLNLAEYQFLTDNQRRAVHDIQFSSVTPAEAIETQRTGPKPIGEKLYNGVFNLSALEKLFFFIEGIKRKIESLLCNQETESRNFVLPGTYGAFSKSRPSSNKDTPSKQRAAPATANINILKGRGNIFSQTKDSTEELHVIQKLFRYPGSFARVFKMHFRETGSICYEFENLSPLLNPYNSGLSRILHRPTPFESLISCLRFAIDCLNGISILHDDLKIVHSDISVNNIMYSSIDESWKLIDFDQCMDASKSESTHRIAGTEGFLAPEVTENDGGYFTKEADIFSFGIVLLDYVFAIFDHQIFGFTEEIFNEEIQRTQIYASKFRKLAVEMIQTDPISRPTAMEALHLLFDLGKMICFEEKINIEVLFSLELLNILEGRKFLIKRGIENEESFLKRKELIIKRVFCQIGEAKEPIIGTTQTIQ